MAKRSHSNPHADEAGYVAASLNARTGQYVVLYDGRLAGFDTSEGHWTVFCVTHGSFCCETNQRRARKLMKEPAVWCEECRDVDEAPRIPRRVVPFSLKSPEEQQKELRFMAKMVKGNAEKVALFETIYGVKPDAFWD